VESPQIMKSLAIATANVKDRAKIDDGILTKSLKEKGFQADLCIWNDPKIRWEDYDLTLIRSTWDYCPQIGLFMNWIGRFESANLPLKNPPALVRWNSHKSYLLDLAQKGVSVVATEVIDHGVVPDIDQIMQKNSWEKVVVKPAIGAGGEMTKLFNNGSEFDFTEWEERSEFTGLLVQEFVPDIVEKGEISLVYFGGRISHAVEKKAASGEFRVQEDYGGQFREIEASSELIEAGLNVLSCLNEMPMYARVDGVQAQDGFLLMELELIEPELFLRLSEAGTQNFVDEIAKVLEAV
jgi:glutathione synthase/RimK-type ligase-like ATP-grasp enzyme